MLRTEHGRATASSSITGIIIISSSSSHLDRCVFSYLKQTYPLLITPMQMLAHTHTHSLINNTQIPNEFQLIPAMCAQQLQFIFVDFSCATNNNKNNRSAQVGSARLADALQKLSLESVKLLSTHKKNSLLLWKKGSC